MDDKKILEMIVELHNIFMVANNFLGELKFYSAKDPSNKTLELADDSLKNYLNWCSIFLMDLNQDK